MLPYKPTPGAGVGRVEERLAFGALVEDLLQRFSCECPLLRVEVAPYLLAPWLDNTSVAEWRVGGRGRGLVLVGHDCGEIERWFKPGLKGGEDNMLGNLQ